MLTKNDFSQIRGIVQEEIAPVKKSLAKIDKKLVDTINFFDKEQLELKDRVKTIERQVGIPLY